MTPASLLSCLVASGFSVRADAGRLLVSPADRLTAELTETIRAAKAGLLELLASEPEPTPLEKFIATHTPEHGAEVIIKVGKGQYRSVSLEEYQAALGITGDAP